MNSFQYLNDINSPHILWMIFCIGLLLFMQLGFCCLEAGLVRSKNSINVVMKNCLDFCISFLGFFFIGSILMFSPLTTVNNTFIDHYSLSEPNTIIPLIFHSMFCSTAVTITSGAVAERMNLKGYLALALITTVLIYPLCGRLIWGDLLYPNQNIALLAQYGFHDFAGATPVHALGGAIALAAVIVVGPRLGRFGQNSQPIRASSFSLASIGIFFLWVGWLGFNGGSKMMLTAQTPSIVLITLVGGLSGMLCAALYSEAKKLGLEVLPVLNGGLAGMVSITAGADIYGPLQALFVGSVAGLLSYWVNPLLERWRLDDGIGVISVHLVTGVWGAFAVGLFKPLSDSQTRFEAVAVQLLGVLAIVFISFVLSYLFLRLLHRFSGLRVPRAAEMIGLNIWENKASTSQIDLLQQMSVQAKYALFNERVTVEPFTPEHDIAAFYNSVLDKFDQVQDEKDKALEEAVWLAEHDPLTGVKNRRALTRILFKEQQLIHRNNSRATIAIMDLDFFKKINDDYGHDAGDAVLKHFANLIKSNIRKTDVFGRFGGEEFVLLMPDTSIEEAQPKLQQLKNILGKEPAIINSTKIYVTMSVGTVEMNKDTELDTALKQADVRLYQAKAQGRNRINCG